MTTRIAKASTLKGTSVKNLTDENIGEIQDLMINLQTGNVEYAVLSFGGFMGIGDKHFAVPVQALNFVAEDNKIRVDINKETLQNAPGFDKENWPSEASPEFIQRVYHHYGYEPNREPFLK